MLNKFGSYFIQKFLEYLNYHQIGILFNVCINNFDLICFNEYSNYLIQIIIKKISGDCCKEKILFEIVLNNFIILTNNNYGTFIIQKIIQCFSYEIKYEILNIIHANFIEIVTNINGISIIKQLIKGIKKNSELFNNSKSVLNSILMEHISKTINHPYGKFVYLCLAEEWEYEYLKDVLNYLINTINYVDNNCIYKHNIILLILRKANFVSKFYIILKIFLKLN